MKKTEKFNTTKQTTATPSKQNNRQKKWVRNSLFCFLVSIALLGATWALWQFNETHFSKGTTINGVDCSWSTVESAYEKLNQQLKERTITFNFTNHNCKYPNSTFDLKIDSTKELEQFLYNQKHGNKEKNFITTEFTLDENKLKSVMKSMSEFDISKMKHPQNAYMALNAENLLTIVPEVMGNYIEFDKAYKLALENLKAGLTIIDFSLIMDSEPEITSHALISSVDDINCILKTSITFNINDDCSLTLDKSVMKDWLVKDSNGNYTIDIDSNIPSFVQLLSEKSANSTVYFDFEATNAGTVRVPAKNLSINEEAEIELIKSELGSCSSHTHTPIYNISIGDNYVEIDKTRQHVWLYKNGQCVVDTDCVTGNASTHDTPRGYFFLSYKALNVTLRGRGYASPVTYWMPFNGGIGLHDATWRSAFGGNIYLTNGSHGCINLPKSAAKEIYDNIDKSMPIIVYSSN